MTTDPVSDLPAPVIELAGEAARHQRRARHAYACAAFLLGVMAAAGGFLAFGPGREGGRVLAQSPGGFGAKGVYAFAGQITPHTYGLWMLDVDAGNLWCYELVQSKEQAPRLRLVACRSWVHDRYLKEFNILGVTPAEVAQMVDDQDPHRVWPPPAEPQGSAPAEGQGKPGSDSPGAGLP